MDTGSWRAFGIEHRLAGPPRADPPHHVLTAWAKGRAAGHDRFAVGWLFVRWVRWRVPGVRFGGREQRLLAKQCAHAVGAHLGGRIYPVRYFAPENFGV